MSFLRNADDLSRPIKGPFSGSRVGSIDSFMRRLCAYRVNQHLGKDLVCLLVANVNYALMSMLSATSMTRQSCTILPGTC